MKKSKKEKHPCRTYQLTSEQIDLLMKGELSKEEIEVCLVKKTRRVTLKDLDAMMERYRKRFVYASWFGINAEEFSIVDLWTGEILAQKSYFSVQYLEDFLGSLMQKGRVAVYVR